MRISALEVIGTFDVLAVFLS